MPIYEAQDIVYVTPYNGSKVEYVFGTKHKEAIRTELGHKAFTELGNSFGVSGSSCPRPGVWKKSEGQTSGAFTTYSTSSFADWKKVDTLTANKDWKQVKSVVRQPVSGGTKSKLYRVNMGNDILIAYRITTARATKITDANLKALGITLYDPTTDNKKTVIAGVGKSNSFFNLTTFSAKGTLDGGAEGETDSVSLKYIDPDSTISMPNNFAYKVHAGKDDGTSTNLDVAAE